MRRSSGKKEPIRSASRQNSKRSSWMSFMQESRRSSRPAKSIRRGLRSLITKVASASASWSCSCFGKYWRGQDFKSHKYWLNQLLERVGATNPTNFLFVTVALQFPLVEVSFLRQVFNVHKCVEFLFSTKMNPLISFESLSYHIVLPGRCAFVIYLWPCSVWDWSDSREAKPGTRSSLCATRAATGRGSGKGLRVRPWSQFSVPVVCLLEYIRILMNTCSRSFLGCSVVPLFLVSAFGLHWRGLLNPYSCFQESNFALGSWLCIVAWCCSIGWCTGWIQMCFCWKQQVYHLMKEEVIQHANSHPCTEECNVCMGLHAHIYMLHPSFDSTHP